MRVARVSEIQEEPAVSPLFTGGAVTRQVIVPPEMANDFNCGIVNFSRGSKNKFHAHTSDQVLIITSGIGIVATEQGGYVHRCVNDIRRRPSQPLIQWRFHPHTVHRDRRLRSTQGPSDA